MKTLKTIFFAALVVSTSITFGAPARAGNKSWGIDLFKNGQCLLNPKRPAQWINEDGQKILKLEGGPTNRCGIASFGFDMRRFLGQEIKMTLTYRYENAKKRPDRWDYEQHENRLEPPMPLVWHWDRANAEIESYVYKDVPFPEGGTSDGWQTLEAYALLLEDDDLSRAGVAVEANIAKGGVLYVKGLRVDVCPEPLLDKCVERAGAKIPKTYRCQYSSQFKNAGKFRGIGMDWKCTQDDLAKVVGWGVNLVRLTGFCPQTQKLAELDAVLSFLKEKGVRVVLSPSIEVGSDLRGRYWFYTDEKALDRYCTTLENLAKDLVGRDEIWGVEILHEPKENVFYNADLDVYSFWEVQYAAIKRIRAVNPNLPLIASADWISNPAGYLTNVMRPFPFKDIWYNVQFYAPTAYTQYGKTTLPSSPQWDGRVPSYPGRLGYRNYVWDYARLQDVLEPVDAFQKKYGARFFVSEFAVNRRLPGAVEWLEDVCDLIEKRADMWAFRKYNDYHGYDLEYMEDAPLKDARKNSGAQESARLKVMKQYWSGKAKPRKKKSVR